MKNSLEQKRRKVRLGGGAKSVCICIKPCGHSPFRGTAVLCCCVV